MRMNKKDYFTENCRGYVSYMLQFSVCTIAYERAINNAIVHKWLWGFILRYITDFLNIYITFKCVFVMAEKKKEHHENEHKKEEHRVQKKNNTTTYVVLAIIVLAAIIFIYTRYYSPNANTEKTDGGEKIVIASVNGEEITLDELEKTYQSVPSQSQISLTKKDLLNSMIEARLLYQEAKKQGFEIS